MGKNEIAWGIFSGVTLLPFTIRSTRRQCLNDRRRYWAEEQTRDMPEIESCRKLIINEANHDSKE